MDRYAVINEQTKEVVNVIAWDGITKWSPPVGHFVKKHEDCGRGDYWDEAKQDFMRPLKNQKSPEDDLSIAERKKHYEESKSKLKTNSTFLFINDSGSVENL